MKKPKSEITEEPVEAFGSPEELMPTPDRLRQEPEGPSEVLEAPVRSLQPQPGVLPAKPVSGIVEPDSLATIRARKDAHLAKLRR